MNEQEKRKHPRVEVKSPMKFRVPTTKMDISIASIKNISGGGICLLTNTKLEMGQIIQMEFGLVNDPTPIVAHGEIVWIDAIKEPDLPFKYQFGVRFIEIEKEKQTNINKFVIMRLKAKVKEEIQRAKIKKSRRKYTVLVVDDDKVVLDMISKVFSSEFNILTAANGFDGVEKAREWRPDLILLDILMPDMDGFSTLLLLKDFDVTRDIPVLMISMLKDKSKIFQAIRGGAHDYILKPFTAESLLVKIHSILDKSE